MNVSTINNEHHHNWFRQAAHVCHREFRLIFNDAGVMIFFILLSLVYPAFYSLIYNPEVVRNVKVVVVDDDRSALSRDFTRRLDATQEIAIVGYAANLEEAREMMKRKECYGIVKYPRDFAQNVDRGIQTHVELFCEMSVMMRYKSMFTALTAVTQSVSNERLASVISPVMYQSGSIIESRQVPLGNTSMGIASAVLLFVLPLVIQQSLVLGVLMLHGGNIERRRRNGGYDPLAVDACVSATIIGKTLCHVIMYIVPIFYVLVFTPMIFSFPQNANPLHVFMLAVPFVIAVSFMGQTLQAFVNERESVFLLYVFTSVIFVFLCGVSWPRYAMSRVWRIIGDCVPSTWISNAYVLMQSNGATLRHVMHPFAMLWVHCAIFYVFAYVVERFVNRRRYRDWQRRCKIDPNALHRYDLIKNGIG